MDAIDILAAAKRQRAENLAKTLPKKILMGFCFGSVLVFSILYALGNTKEFTVSIAEFLSETARQSGSSVIPPEENLTERFSAALVREFIEQNPENPEVDSEGNAIANFDAETASNNILVEFLENSPAGPAQKSIDQLFPDFIKVADFYVINDDSADTIQGYLSKVRDIMNKHLSEYKEAIEVQMFNEAMEKNDMAPLRLALSRYNLAISELENIPVPKSWTDIHKENLQILMISRMMFESFLKYKQDPMGALIAGGIQQEFLKKIQDAQIKLNNRLAELNY